MCHWPLKGSRKAKKSERGANGRGPLPRRRLFFRRFFRGGDASKKARCSESQRRKIGRPRPHWRSGSVLTPPLEEQPGKTELSLSLALFPSLFPHLFLFSRFNPAFFSAPSSSPTCRIHHRPASPLQPSFPLFLPLSLLPPTLSRFSLFLSFVPVCRDPPRSFFLSIPFSIPSSFCLLAASPAFRSFLFDHLSTFRFLRFLLVPHPFSSSSSSSSATTTT